MVTEVQETDEAGQPRERKKSAPAVSIEFLLVLGALLIALAWLFWPDFGSHPPGMENESSAISTLRTLSSVQYQYWHRHGRYAVLDELGKANLIDGALVTAAAAGRARRGYRYEVVYGADCWSVVAVPEEPGKSGRRSFYMDATGDIRYAECRNRKDPPAGPDNPRLGE